MAEDLSGGVSTSGRALVGAGLWVLVARVIGAAVFAINNMILARVLGPAEFGYFAVAVSGATFAGFLASAGLNRTLLRFLSVGRSRGDMAAMAARQRLSAMVLRVSLPSVAILSSAVTLGIVRRWDLEAVSLAVGVGLLAAGFGLQQVLGDALRGFGEIRVASFLEGRSGGTLVLMVHTMLLLPFLLSSISPGAAVTLNVAAFAIAMPPATIHLRRLWRKTYQQASQTTGTLEVGWERAYLTSSAVFVGTQVVAFLSTQFDLWIAGISLGGEDLSVFAAALRLMILVSMPLIAIQFAISPSVAQLHDAGDRVRLERHVRRAATLAAIPSVLMLLFIAAAPGSLLGVLFGPVFADGGGALVWLAVGQLVNSLTGMCGPMLVMTGEERSLLLVGLTIVGAKLGLGIPAVAIWGVTGLAALSGITTALFFLAQWVIVRRRFGIWTHPAGIRDLRSVLRT